jgi:hypothetical protein
MLSLPEMQTRFFNAVMSGGAAEDGLLVCLAEPDAFGRQRLAVYRRSIMGNLVSALAATYPVLAKIVGLPFFREAARAYVRAHPSASGDLNEYGGGFADFIALYPYGRELGYLADVARLEWLVQEVYYAPEPASADLSTLAACVPEDYGRLRFAFSGDYARLDSPWPLTDIWRVNAEGYEGELAVDFSRGAQVLVLRRDGLVEVEALAGGEAAFLDALAAGAPLASATEAALQVDANFDLGAALTRFIGAGIVRGAHLDPIGDPT